ncbi:MAG: serine hydrolase domain-containing protein, partial [Bacteroidota bacterium]|nr:serine hydrolase domain-containing protein [Bacteroidota bacterium]
MKKKYILIISTLLITFVFNSCNNKFNIPVENCTEVTNDNATNPKTSEYQAILDKYTNLGLPGLSLAVHTNTNGIWIGSSGYSCLEDKIKMKSCNVHHSASIAKTYIATAVLILVDQNKLDLKDLAKKYLPETVYSNVSNAELATIEQLLNHRSGIYNFDDNLKVYVNSFNSLYGVSSTLELIEKYVYGIDAYFEVGQDYHYSNTNYTLLGMIIEDVSGMSLGKFIEDNIITPLNLKETYYKNSLDYPEIPNLVNSYYELYENNLSNCSDIQRHFADLAKGHEGMIASPNDFAIFIKNLVTGNILSPEMTEIMINSTNVDDYGLGIYTFETDYGNGVGHSGGAIGTMTYAIYFPDSDISFALACNFGPVFGGELVTLFYDDLYE